MTRNSCNWTLKSPKLDSKDTTKDSYFYFNKSIFIGAKTSANAAKWSLSCATGYTLVELNLLSC